MTKATISRKKLPADSIGESLPSVVTRPVREFKLGPFRVIVSNKQHYRLYTIFGPRDLVCGKQVSYPSEDQCWDTLDDATQAGRISRGDCDDFYRKHAGQKRSLRVMTSVKTKMSKGK